MLTKNRYALRQLLALRSLCRANHRLGSTDLPSEADCVVIGGGSVGCSTFYHLTKFGAKNSVLLEKHKLTSGTTWHTAGLQWNLRPNDVEIELLCYTRELISKILPSEVDQDTGWINNGGLFIATTKERMDEYLRLMTIGKAFGVESHALTPKETKDIYPLMNVDDVYGALISPSDGLMDPNSWCSSLAKAGTQRGGRVVEDCPVTGVTTVDDGNGYRKVTGVDTKYGHIKTSKVVNCAGAWGPKIAEAMDIPAPTIAYHHQYAITERIEGIQNMPNVRDHDGAFYLRLQGDALAVGGYEYNPVICGQGGEVPNDFAFGLYNINWDAFSDIVEKSCNRVPVLRNTGIKTEICGPLSFTPDDKPLNGEAPKVKGFFYGHGYDLGMMLGGGGGRELAKWVINGRPDLHLYAWDIRRLNPGVTRNPKWILERCHERFATIYKAVYPKDEPMACRNMFRSPFHEELLKDGCFFQERHSWERAGWFDPEKQPAPPKEYDFYGAYDYERHTDDLYEKRLMYDYTFEFPKHFDVIRNEALTCRNAVVGFDMSYFGKFYLTGPDSQKAVDWIFSNDINKPPGATIYTCMLNQFGSTEADLTVSVIESGSGSPCDPQFEGRGFYIAAGGGAAYHDWVHIENAIHDKGFDVQLVNRTEDMGMLSIQGPNSRALLQELAPDADFSDAGVPFSTNKMISINGHKCRVLRLSFVGELGFELHIPTESCVPVYRLIHEVGSKFGFRNAGYRAMECLSAEKGYRFWDSDLRISDTPLEAGLAFTCKLKSDVDFLGRKAIEQQKKNGIRKRIVCVLPKEKKMLHGLETIFRDGVVVGYTRRAEYGFVLDQPLAYAYISRPDGAQIKNDWIKAGNYEIECFGTKYPAEVCMKPPFDTENKRIKGIYE